MGEASPISDTLIGTHRQVTTGVIWAYLAFLVEKLSTFATTAILARLLVPEQFGVLATALLFLGILDALRSFGVTEALVYLKLDSRDADTAFWFQLVLGIALALASALSAPALAYAFGIPELGALIPFMAVGFIFNGLGLTHQALVQKQLGFARIYTVDLISAVIKAAIAISLALAGYGIWAVAIGYVVGMVCRCIGRWLTYRWLPRWSFDLQRLRNLLAYGKNILYVSLLDIPLERADQFIVLTLLGETQVGLYYIAAKLPEILIFQVNSVVTRVLFPVMSAIRENIVARNDYIMGAARYTCYVIAPISVGLACVSDLITYIAFGSQWGASAPLLTLLALVGFVETVTWSLGDGLKAAGRPDVLFRLTVLQMVILVPFILAGTWLTGSPIGAAGGLLAGILLSNVIRLWVVAKVLQLPVRTFLAALKGSVVAVTCMALAVLGLRGIVGNWDAGAQLIVIVGSGGLVYCGMLWLLERRHILSALDLVANRGERSTP